MARATRHGHHPRDPSRPISDLPIGEAQAQLPDGSDLGTRVPETPPRSGDVTPPLPPDGTPAPSTPIDDPAAEQRERAIEDLGRHAPPDPPDFENT